MTQWTLTSECIRLEMIVDDRLCLTVGRLHQLSLLLLLLIMMMIGGLTLVVVAAYK